MGNTEVADSREGTRKQHVLSPRQEAMGQWLCVCAKSLQLCPTLCNPMDCSRQGPLSMGFSRQEYWSGLPFPSPGHLPDPGLTLGSPALQAESIPS